MSTSNYYAKYREKDDNKIQETHASHIPNRPIKELEMFYKRIKKQIGKKILDIGSGEGVFIEFLQKNGSYEKISGLEISEHAIGLAKTKNPKVDFVLGSADDIYPFEDKSYDTLFMTDVIEHLVDIDMAISECNRVLEKNGYLIIITPDYNRLKKIIIGAFFREKIFYPTNPHVRFFTKKSMDDIMKKHGFISAHYSRGLTRRGIMPQNSYFIYKKI